MNELTQLRSSGFQITNLKNIKTVVEHTKPFSVQATHGKIAAILNEDTAKYTITFDGWCTNGHTPNHIELDYLSLMQSVNEQSDAILAHRAASKQLQLPNVTAALFGDIALQETFYKTHNGSKYIKCSDSTARKIDSISSSLELIIENTDSVFIDNEPDFSTLDIEQKWDIVFNLPTDQFDQRNIRAGIADELEQIPGLEMLDDRQRASLINELHQMWLHHNKLI